MTERQIEKRMDKNRRAHGETFNKQYNQEVSPIFDKN